MNIIKMSIHHASCAWTNGIGTLFCVSYSQDELVAGAISYAVYKHARLKELTTGKGCSPSLVNGAVGGIFRKAGMKKLVVKEDFPGEL